MSKSDVTSEELGQVAQLIMPDLTAKANVFAVLTMIVLGWLSSPLETIIRYNFGERYMTPLRILVSLMTVGLFYWGYNILNPVSILSAPSQLCSLAFFVLFGVIQLLIIYVRNTARETWHSMSSGVSGLYLLWYVRLEHLSWTPKSIGKVLNNDWLLYCIIEPVVCFILGMTVVNRLFGGAVGTWMQVASISLALKNIMIYQQIRSRMLDRSDARIEAEYLNNAEQGKPKIDTAGFSVVSLPKEPLTLDNGTKLTFANLLKEMREKYQKKDQKEDTSKTADGRYWSKPTPTQAPSDLRTTLDETLTEPAEANGETTGAAEAPPPHQPTPKASTLDLEATLNETLGTTDNEETEDGSDKKASHP